MNATQGRAQDRAVAILKNELGIPPPSSNLEWLFWSADHGLHECCKMQDIEVYSHGFGVRLESDELSIDFDWGDHGEPDGFDAWRFWVFAEDNCPDLLCNSVSHQKWLDDQQLQVN